ncbi:hypothetical protein ACM1ZW_08795 [Pseudomonas sp. NFX71]|uniref:hypothetical protein n=1 Tax=Pseudomonas sp. NFX71 TaxID=3399121 RepID=UPI003A83FB4F
MFTRNWPRHLLCLSLSLPLGSALACGPDFPMRLLDNRGQSLAELPEGNFRFEINRLGHAIAGLKNVTEVVYNSLDATDYAEQRDKAEQAGLTVEQQAQVKQLRSLTDAHQVEAQGASLPTELVLYLAGAVAFNAGDPGLAAEYFQKVLALPADQRALRSTWAAYSLGRALFVMSAEADAKPDLLTPSRKAFEQARQLSIDGFSDPLELGVASLGEEARVARTAGDWNRAIELYATQNLHGSAVGYTSLKLLVADLAAMPDEQLAALLEGKPVQQLITASLISRLGWSFGDQPPNEQKLIKLLQASTRGSLDNADRLAAVNYQQGDYASAKAFLEHAGDGGLAWWLRAKLAMREGDKTAAAAYAKAAQAFAQNESWGERRTPDWDFETLQPKCRVEGESAILALQRGDYLQAFDQLYRSNDIYWFDAATVAERVLTVDELKHYVDTQVPAPPALTQQDRDNYVPLPVAAKLRNLLGRRLLREERYDEAPAYFGDAELQNKAKAYGQLRQEAESAWWPTRRAEALFNAAKIAREWGMDILGYEMAPDYATFGGNYSLESTELKVGPLVAEEEVKRQHASAAQPDQRFHYRYVANALASRAADHLPHTSQAFAAVLCAATGWNTDQEQKSAFYQRYVKEGPYVDWALFFGERCPYPDFQNADKRYVTQALSPIRATLRPYKKWLEVGGILVFTALALLLVNRHKRKARQ